MINFVSDKPGNDSGDRRGDFQEERGLYPTAADLQMCPVQKGLKATWNWA